MYEMPAIPTANDVVHGDLGDAGRGVKGVKSGRNVIQLHQGSLIALQEHARGLYPDMKVAVASSADTPLAEKIGSIRSPPYPTPVA